MSRASHPLTARYEDPAALEMTPGIEKKHPHVKTEGEFRFGQEWNNAKYFMPCSPG